MTIAWIIGCLCAPGGRRLHRCFSLLFHEKNSEAACFRRGNPHFVMRAAQNNSGQEQRKTARNSEITANCRKNNCVREIRRPSATAVEPVKLTIKLWVICLTIIEVRVLRDMTVARYNTIMAIVGALHQIRTATVIKPIGASLGAERSNLGRVSAVRVEIASAREARLNDAKSIWSKAAQNLPDAVAYAVLRPVRCTSHTLNSADGRKLRWTAI